jgi:uncharacterized protein with PIN domain
MILARVIRPHFGLLRGLTPARNRGAVCHYRCRRYIDDTINVQLIGPGERASQPDDILVEIIATSFTAPLQLRGLKTADGFLLAIDLATDWHVEDPRPLLAVSYLYQQLREHSVLEAAHASVHVERQARDHLGSAVATLRYSDLRSQGNAALRVLEQALRGAAAPALRLEAAAITAIASEDGDAHLAAEASARAREKETLEATATTEAEIARVKAEADLVRARREAETEIEALIGAVRPGAAHGPREALVRMARARRHQARRLVTIGDNGSFEADTDPAGLPIAVIGRPISYTITAQPYGFIVLLVIATSRRTQLLLPNDILRMGKRLGPLERIKFPPEGGLLSPRPEFSQLGPVGDEQVVAIISNVEILTEEELRSTARDGCLSDEVLTQMNRRLAAIPPEEWSADLLEYRVRDRTGM